MACTVLAIPVLSSSSQTNLEKIDILNPLHIEPCSEVESLLAGSSSSHIDFPHIPLLVYTLLTIRKRVFDKTRVVNRLLQLVSRCLSIRILSTYNGHICVTDYKALNLIVTLQN